MGWFNHQPVQGFNIVIHFSLVLACWANRNTVLVETFCVIFPDPKPGESPSIYSKIHLLSDMFFWGATATARVFFLDFQAIFSVSVTFVPNLFGPKDALLRLLAVSNRHESRPKGFRGFPPEPSEAGRSTLRLFHINGNAIYNLTHPWLTSMIQTLQEELTANTLSAVVEGGLWGSCCWWG